MSNYFLKGYSDGRCVAEGEYDFLHEALTAASDALCGASGPAIDEYEICTRYSVAGLPGKQETLLAYGHNEDVASQREEHSDLKKNSF